MTEREGRAGPATDTIFALSSGAGKAGVAVFRLSGPGARAALNKFSKRKVKPRRVVHSSIFNPETGGLIDEGIIFSFAGPASFTGEDMAEIQVHGSHAVIDVLSDALVAAGIRPAEPGEFTLRAFRNGKLDLAQAEALADLIDAETSLQQQQALDQLGGGLSALAEDWRKQLTGILAPLEAGIDFPDEADIPEKIEGQAAPVIRQLIQDLEAYLEASTGAQRLRRGVSVVLLGPPNAGKSSLLNRLAGSDIAIVSATPGTTRDALEVRIDLEGIPVTITDTAGLRDETSDEIEEEGMRRARQKAETADLRIGLLDGNQSSLGKQISALELDRDDIVVLNKSDLRPASPNEISGKALGLPLNLSLKTGKGFEDFLDVLKGKVKILCGNVEEPRLTRARHVHAAKEAILALKRSLEILALQPELSAEDVRLAARHLGAITGAVDVEDVLGEIFSSFCIGK